MFNILFLLIVLLAGASVYQFFRGRKKNLLLLELASRSLEKHLKPRDKNYLVIGVYIGFKGFYKIFYKSLERMEATVLLLPRQSLIYYPISKLTSRFDRIFLVFWYNKEIVNEAHLIRKGYYRLGLKKTIKGIEEMIVKQITLAGKQYYLVYKQRDYAEKILDFAKRLHKPDIINHIAIVPQNNTLYMAVKYDPITLDDLLNKAYEFAKTLA